MTKESGLNRRSFLRNAGLTAVLAGAGSPLDKFELGEGSSQKGSDKKQQVKYDFDEVYDRVGTDSVKWDRAGQRHSTGLDVGMGIADMDFKAPPCIGEALAERCEHENWGYLSQPSDYVEAIVSWNQRRYGLDIDLSLIHI